LKINVNGNNYDVEVIGEKATVNGKEIVVKSNEDEIIIDGSTFRVDFVEEGEPSLMIINGLTYMVSKSVGRAALVKDIKTPISGKIIHVLVKVGMEVKKGQLLFVLEAMKMENQIASPVNGKIAAINVIKGQSVRTGEVLLTFE